MGLLIAEELRDKLDAPDLVLEWAELRASDIQARPRAWGNFVSNGMDPIDASIHTDLPLTMPTIPIIQQQAPAQGEYEVRLISSDELPDNCYRLTLSNPSNPNADKTVISFDVPAGSGDYDLPMGL